MICFSMLIIMNPLLKLKGGGGGGGGGGDRRSLFVIFCSLECSNCRWVGGWVVVAWGRKSYLGPTEISYLCTWFNSRMGDSG